MTNDTTASALNTIDNALKAGKQEAHISPTSTTVRDTLLKLQEHTYIKVFEEVEDGRGDQFRVHLEDASINRIKPVKPNFFVGSDEYQKWEKRHLPARGFGDLIVTTPEGVMTHEEAREQNLGGRLLGYVY